MGQNPGRPAYPRPAGLAPLHIEPRLRSRGNVMHPNASKPRIERRFVRMDRKACTRIKGPTIQCKDMSKSAIQHPGVITSVESQRWWNGGPAQARERLAGLALSAFELRKLHRLQENISDVHAKAVARWPHPQAGRRHSAPSQAPASRGS